MSTDEEGVILLRSSTSEFPKNWMALFFFLQVRRAVVAEATLQNEAVEIVVIDVVVET